MDPKVEGSEKVILFIEQEIYKGIRKKIFAAFPIKDTEVK